MERHLDEELKKLNTHLLTMAALVEKSIHRSVEAFKKQDKGLAEGVIQDDERIDEMEIVIEEEAIELLALFQPMAVDLRFITTGMHINTELERIGDLTVNISQRVLDVADQSQVMLQNEISSFAEQAKLMVKSAIDAFVKHDEELAKKVIFSDKEANNLRNTLMARLINEYMVKDSASVPIAVALLLLTRDLERISDHAASIAEDVIYMVNARIIKHHRERLEDR